MSNFEKYDLGRPEGSTFSTTLHLLSPRMQEWIRGTTDRKKLRRFSCACARLLLAESSDIPPLAMKAVELAERYCDGLVADADLEAAYLEIAQAVHGPAHRLRAVQQAVDAGQSGLEDLLAAELAQRATLAARACVLRSAPVGAAEVIFEYNLARSRRKRHEVLTFFLAQADLLLDRLGGWVFEEQGELLQSYLRDLPRPFVTRFQQSSDAGLRRFACACADGVVDHVRKKLAVLGTVVDLEPLSGVIEAARKFADGKAGAAELKAAYEAGLQLAREWYRKEDEVREQLAEQSGAKVPGLVAEAADAVYVCAEAQARLAAVKSLQVALHALTATDIEEIYPLAEQYLGPPPPERPPGE
jgi:hypothetical protein